MPNRGRKKQHLGIPKTSLSKVLLYDNITQQQMLDMRLANIKIEKDRRERFMDLSKRYFSLKMNNRFRQLRAMAHPKPLKLPALERNVTSTSKITERTKTFSIEDVKLPRLKDHDKEIIFRVKSKSGHKRIYYSYDDDGIFVDFVPLFSFYEKVHDDPRFQNLETRLISAPDDKSYDGFAVLSPSYDVRLPKVPTFLKLTNKPGSNKDN